MIIRFLKLIFILFYFACCDEKKINYNTIEIKDEITNVKIFSSLEKGKAVYDLRCASCHGADGDGMGRNFPPLANTDYIKESTDEKLYSIIINGIYGEIIVNGIIYNSAMPPIDINEGDVKYVVEYIKSLNNE